MCLWDYIFTLIKIQCVWASFLWYVWVSIYTYDMAKENFISSQEILTNVYGLIKCYTVVKFILARLLETEDVTRVLLIMQLGIT